VKRAPAIGDRVSFPGNLAIGPCTGTVYTIFPAHGDRGRLLPEEQWHVGVKVDAIPRKWPYLQREKFAPQVSTLTLIPKE